jgi:hypothetical protein
LNIEIGSRAEYGALVAHRFDARRTRLRRPSK